MQNSFTSELILPEVVAAVIHEIDRLSEHFQMVARLWGHLDQLVVRVEATPGAEGEEHALAAQVKKRLYDVSKELMTMYTGGLIADVVVEIVPSGGLTRNPRIGKIKLTRDERCV